MSDTDFRNPVPSRTGLRQRAPTHQSDDTAGFREPLSGVGRLPLRAQPTWDQGQLRSAGDQVPDPGIVPGRGRGPSGAGSADGGNLRPAGGRGDLDGPCFDLQVPPDGYAWWYVDGLSDCGRYGVSVIAFIGSVFSPWYRWYARRNPHDHVCINVALYGPGGRFTMTERGEGALQQSAQRLQVGPSSVEWRDGELIIDVDEISNPIISHVKGQIRLKPSGITGVELPLTPDGTHVWRPFAPTARIEVDLNRSHWQWKGHGYFDANFGTRALEDDFSYWTWGRYPVADGTVAYYDANRRDGSTLAAGIHFDRDGRASMVDAPPPKTSFDRNLWMVRRETRADPGYKPREVLPMLHAPFYARAAVQTQIGGVETVGVHEAIDLNRFASPLLKPMLAVRVPRVPDWAAFARP